jgi:hypothetical protein
MAIINYTAGGSGSSIAWTLDTTLGRVTDIAVLIGERPVTITLYADDGVTVRRVITLPAGTEQSFSVTAGQQGTLVQQVKSALTLWGIPHRVAY